MDSFGLSISCMSNISLSLSTSWQKSPAVVSALWARYPLLMSSLSLLCPITWSYSSLLLARMYLMGTCPVSRYNAGMGTLGWHRRSPLIRASSSFSNAVTLLFVRPCHASLLNSVGFISRDFLSSSPASTLLLPSGASCTMANISFILPQPLDSLLKNVFLVSRIHRNFSSGERPFLLLHIGVT